MSAKYVREAVRWSLPSRSSGKENPELKGDACDPSEDGGSRGGARGGLPSRRVRKRTSFHQPCCKLKSEKKLDKVKILNEAICLFLF